MMMSMMWSLAASSARRQLFPSRTCPQIAVRGVYIVVNPRKARQKTEKTKKKGGGGGRASYRFVDRTRVRVEAGDGGKGNLSVFKIGRKHKRRPDGGHGGRGGNVIIVADPKQQSLNWTRPHVRAQSGSPGSSQEKHGRNGKNLILRVPCGVVVRRVLDFNEVWDPVNSVVQRVEQESVRDDQGVEYVFEMDLEDASSDSDDEDAKNDLELEENAQTNASFVQENENPLELRLPEDDESSVSSDDAVAGDCDDDELITVSSELGPDLDRETVVLADLDTPGAHVVVARGGRGGFGNCTYAKRNGPLPDPSVLLKRARAQEGEVAFLELELKLIADLGLVGFPNAGKSSLLAAMSRAMPEIAPYPFTTLNPLVGCIEYRDGYRVMAADVPGLVRGASEGRGRGHDFLRHLERTKALLYIVDAAGVDGRGPLDDLFTLVDELSSYGDGDMLSRPSIVVANKVDLLDEEQINEILLEMGDAAEDAGIRLSGNVLGISAGVSGVGLGPLSKAIRNAVMQSEKDRHDPGIATANFY